MATCPLTDGELRWLVRRTAEQLAHGVAKDRLVREIAEIGWDRGEVAEFVDEIAQKVQELGRAPGTCNLLRSRATRHLRHGLLSLALGGTCAICGYLVGAPQVGWAVGAVSLLYGCYALVCGVPAHFRSRGQ